MSTDTRSDPRLRGVLLLDVRQVAELFQVHRRTVWRMAAAGDIPAPIRISDRVVRWRLRDIERHLEKAKPA